MLAELRKYTPCWRVLFYLFGAGLCLIVAVGCSEETEKTNAPPDPALGKPQSQAVQNIFLSVSPREAQEMLEKKTGVLLVDVRTPEEIKQMKIAGSLPIPVGDVIRGKFLPPRDKPIILVCAVGGRSYVAGKALASRGYREVYNLDGGVEAWRRAGLPLEGKWK